MRKIDIDELLTEVNEILGVIYQRQLQAVNDSEIQQISKTKVKSAIEHLRSILDYIANDIYEDVLHRPRLAKDVKVYFPYGFNSYYIEQNINKIFPGLKRNRRDIFDLLMGIQTPSRTGWLYLLCKLRNPNTHSKLSQQNRKNNVGYSFYNGNAYLEGEFTNCHMSHNTYTDKSGQIKTSGSITLNTRDSQFNFTDKEREENDIEERQVANFFFQENDQPVIELIGTAYSKIRDFTEKLYLLIP